jgi:hypothetical protein
MGTFPKAGPLSSFASATAQATKHEKVKPAHGSPSNGPQALGSARAKPRSDPRAVRSRARNEDGTFHCGIINGNVQLRE